MQGVNNSQLHDRANFCTNKRLNNIKFAYVDILKILKDLDINKAHRPGNFSIRIINLCRDSICKPPKLIFPDCLKDGSFSSSCIKVNIVPIQKRTKRISS